MNRKGQTLITSFWKVRKLEEEEKREKGEESCNENKINIRFLENIPRYRDIWDVEKSEKTK